MSFTDFAKIQPIKVFDTDEETAVGNAVTFNTSTQVKHCRILLYKHGSGFSGTESLVLKLYSDENRTKLAFESQQLLCSQITNPPISTADFWIGKVRFDFEPEIPILSGDAYYASIAISGYTRNGDDYYIGIGFDTPKPVNTVDVQDPPALLEFYGVR